MLDLRETSEAVTTTVLSLNESASPEPAIVMKVEQAGSPPFDFPPHSSSLYLRKTTFNSNE